MLAAPTPLVAWLHALGRTLSAMTLYADGHPARNASLARLRDGLAELLKESPSLRLTFLEQEVIVGRTAVHDLRDWDWARRFHAAGVQHVQFDAPAAIEGDAFPRLLSLLHSAIAPGTSPLGAPVSLGGITVGPVGVIGGSGPGGTSSPRKQSVHPDERIDELPDLVDPDAAQRLAEELETMAWIHESAAEGAIPLAEVEAVVRGLSMAMQREQYLLMPLIALKSADQYTSVHACNVAMLSMGLAETMGFSSRDVRAIGVAALTHDIGKTGVRREVIAKPGALSPEELAEMRRHPELGARMLGARGSGYALSAIVAYEHHRWANGQGGYPHVRHPRAPHFASRLVQVCDVYDAMSTERPYRRATPRAEVMPHLRALSGRELDADLVHGFSEMLTRAGAAAMPAGV